MKRSLLLASLLALGIAGCGDKPAPPPPPKKPPETTKPIPPTPVPPPAPPEAPKPPDAPKSDAGGAPVGAAPDAAKPTMGAEDKPDAKDMMKK